MTQRNGEIFKRDTEFLEFWENSAHAYTVCTRPSLSRKAWERGYRPSPAARGLRRRGSARLAPFVAIGQAIDYIRRIRSGDTFIFDSWYSAKGRARNLTSLGTQAIPVLYGPLLYIYTCKSCTSLVSDICLLHSGSNISDHSLLFFAINITCGPLTSHCFPFHTTTPPLKIDWSKVTDTNACQFHDLISKNLPSFPQEILHCSSPDCTAHLKSIDSYTQSFISILDSCSLLCFPLSSLLLLFLLKYLDGRILVQTNFKRCQSSGIVSG